MAKSVRSPSRTGQERSITVAGKMDHETVGLNVVPNIGIDSFIDDLSSVDSKGLPYQDCPSHVGKQSGSMHQQHTPGQADGEERERRRRRKGEKKERREARLWWLR